MTYTREQQAEHRAWWVADLRSGQYRQAHGVNCISLNDDLNWNFNQIASAVEFGKIRVEGRS